MWTERFAYKMEISWPVFLASFVVILFVGAAALSYHTIKAVTSNPIDALRHE
jgi:putative ABC transport system permease protein